MTYDDEKLRRNLQDADCNSEVIEKFFQFKQTGRTSEQLKLLNVQRKHLLETLHKNQKQIDCLDYLIFQLEQGIDKNLKEQKWK